MLIRCIHLVLYDHFELSVILMAMLENKEYNNLRAFVRSHFYESKLSESQPFMTMSSKIRHD